MKDRFDPADSELDRLLLVAWEHGLAKKVRAMIKRFICFLVGHKWVVYKSPDMKVVKLRRPGPYWACKRCGKRR